VVRIDGEVLEIVTWLRISLISLICVVAAATLFAIQWGRRGEEEGPPPVKMEADLTSKNIHLVGDKSGLKGWELEAKEARHFLGGKMTVLEGIEAVFYIEKGGAIRLTGDRGKILHRTRDIELQGNIVISNADGYQMRTEGLQYDDGKRKIGSSQRVDIAGRGLEITGKGMSIDLVTGRLTMGGGVETVLSESLREWEGVLPRWNQ
jgi:LPS export ABC transporter protein LptC